MGSCFSVQISGGDSFINQCWNCLALRFMLVRQLSDNLQKLATERDILMALKNDVMRRVNNEEGPHTKRLDRVQNWLSNVEAKIAQADQLVTNGDEAKLKLCCGGYCSTEFYSTYSFGKLVAESVSQAIALKQDGGFEQVVDRIPPEVVTERPSNPAVGLESNLEKVWKWLMEDEEAGLIAIFGMGGVGKTTLLTKINNKFLNSSCSFGFVIWLVVSKDVRVEMLQDQIAEKIGLSNDPLWKEKTSNKKAETIFKALQKKRFTLLLDDLWDRVELQQIGIPAPSRENKCKLVFTTRSEGVCGEMEAQRRIKVDPLAWEDSWKLFQDKVGTETLSTHPDIQCVAVDVAKECAGLPLALITIGRAMALKKTIQQWKHALDVLKESAATFKGMGDKVFPTLKFSYDNLPNQKVKSCLLYCTLFPEDFEIPKHNLIVKWICESFWDDGNNRTDAINEGYDIVATLVHVCLLEDKGQCVKMHDVIRDMCVWIACETEKEKENYLVQAGCQLTKAPELRKWTEVRRVSLMQNKVQQLTEVPESPCLLTLFLSLNDELKMITDGFFQYMKALTVLDLSRTRINALPFGIGELVSLRHLNISGTRVRSLPWELTKLTKLKCFYLEYIYGLKEIPTKMMASFPLLEILGMRAPNMFMVTTKSILEELESLEHLKELTITVSDNPYVLHHLLSSPKFQSCIRHLDVWYLAGWFSEQDEETGARTASPDGIDQGLRHKCFTSLHIVRLTYCNHIKDLTWLILAPNLMELAVKKCRNIKEILSQERLGEFVEDDHDQYDNLNAFSSLESLWLIGLPNLQSTCWKSMLFPSLESIYVDDCSKLKKLPLSADSAKSHNFEIVGSKEWWEGLQWEDDATRTAFKSCFRERIKS